MKPKKLFSAYKYDGREYLILFISLGKREGVFD